MQNPETPPKIPRPPTTPPPKLARQLDNMSNEVKSLFVIARNLQRDRDCHKTSFLMCFTRLTNLQNNVKEMQNVVSWKISDLITRVFADEQKVDGLLASSQETASIIECQKSQISKLTDDVTALRMELDELKTVVRFLNTGR